MSITFDIRPELTKYSTKHLVAMFEAFALKIKQRDELLGKSFKMGEIVVLKDGRVLVEDKSEKGVFYDEDGIPLNREGKIELVEVDYNDLPKSVQKKFDNIGKLEFVEF